MSFVSKDDVFRVVEGMMSAVFKDTIGVELKTPFRISYADAINIYGSDKPDSVSGLSLRTHRSCPQFRFNAFKAVLEAGGSS